MSVTAHLRIVQLNMGRAAAVSDQLLAYCQNTGVDMAMVQEPYTNRGKLTGFEAHPIRCYLSKGTRRRGGPAHIDHGAAILVFNPDLVVVARNAGEVENFVSVDLDCGVDGIVTFTSGYFKYRVPTVVHVETLDRVQSQASQATLIALDANAFSTRWHSRINDRRGQILSAWVDEKRLRVINKRSAHTTFNGPRGRTNIDVTMCSECIFGKTHEWKVIPGATSSDHQLISFTMELQLREFVHRPRRFVLHRDKSVNFAHEFNARLLQRQEDNEDLDTLSQALRDITAAAEMHATRRRRNKKVFPPWWSLELTEARKAVRVAARQWNLTGDRQRFNELRNSYTRLLRRSKIESWWKFCTSEGKLPWGKLYKWMRGANQVRSAPGLMRKPDGSLCQSIDESVTLLLNTLIPNDPLRRDEYRPIQRDGEVQPFDEVMLRKLTWSISPNRAPGQDGITGRMLRALWQSLAPKLLCIVNRSLSTSRFPAIWKHALVVPILKGQDRDARIPKSYRPVSLLPVLGKVIEKAINHRLQEQIGPSLTGRQYGFTQGKSTADAIQNLLSWGDRRDDKHVISVFLDISGAFDNLQWPALERDLASLGVNGQMRALIADYLNERTASMCIGGVSKTVCVNKGCP